MPAKRARTETELWRAVVKYTNDDYKRPESYEAAFFMGPTFYDAALQALAYVLKEHQDIREYESLQGDKFTKFMDAHRTFMREKTQAAFEKVQDQWEIAYGEPEFGLESTGDRMTVERVSQLPVKGNEKRVLALIDKLEHPDDSDVENESSSNSSGDS